MLEDPNTCSSSIWGMIEILPVANVYISLFIFCVFDYFSKNKQTTMQKHMKGQGRFPCCRIPTSVSFQLGHD